MTSEYQTDYPSSYHSVAIARRAVVHFARCVGLVGDALADFEYAVGEALANAAEHGCSADSTFSVRAKIDDGSVSVEIKDSGCGFRSWEDESLRRPEPLSPRGFGIFLMQKLVDEVRYFDGGSRIRIRKRVPESNIDGLCQLA